MLETRHMKNNYKNNKKNKDVLDFKSPTGE